ncbi:caspase family protein [Actinoplanes sp. NPDC049802]|uniref:caspase family protein n=1 Tax=Actinoplanes sp. NPDC049802 TaxID=3154742 RepID=UPI0033D18E70
MKTLYALLVGINEYQAAGLPNLSGCVNDVAAAEAHLWATLAPGTRLEALILRDGEATRDAVIAAFRSHLGQAGPDDVALFWFSGHGSDAEAPDWAEGLEASGRVQTLVCADSRADGVPDLWDKELALLIDELDAGHITVVLDSCHSSSASRDPAYPVRAVPRSAASRPDRSFLPGTIERAAAVPPMRHVELSASRSDETAQERPLDGAWRGVFSWALIGSRERLGAEATYHELLQAVRAELAGRWIQQTSGLRSNIAAELDQPFLGGAVAAPGTGVQMRWGHGGWTIDAGTVHGIPAESGMRVGVHNAPEQEAEIVEVRTEDCLVEPAEPWRPDRNKRFPVVMTSVPLPRTSVTVIGAGAADLTAAIGRSRHLRAPEPGRSPDVRVTLEAGGNLVITDRYAERLAEWEHTGPDAVERAVRALEHIARWRLIWGLRNPAPGITAPVGIEIVDPDTGQPLQTDEHGEYVLRYTWARTGWKAPRIRIRLHNSGAVPLFCVLLDLTPRFAATRFLFGGDFIGPGVTVYCRDRNDILVQLPADVPVEPGAFARDRLKLFAAERTFPTRPYELPVLHRRLPGRRKGLGAQGLLERLGDQIMYRDMVDAGLDSAYDWTTAEAVVKTVVPSIP